MVKNEYGHNFILCLCISNKKMFLYGENSILIKRFEYDKLADVCGKPFKISVDGLMLLFQHSDMCGDVYVVRISINGLKVIKKINIKKSIE